MDPELETVQSLIDHGALSIPVPRPLVNRCECGRVISDTRIACRACAMAALREAREAAQAEPICAGDAA